MQHIPRPFLSKQLPTLLLPTTALFSNSVLQSKQRALPFFFSFFLLLPLTNHAITACLITLSLSLNTINIHHDSNTTSRKQTETHTHTPKYTPKLIWFATTWSAKAATSHYGDRWLTSSQPSSSEDDQVNEMP